MRLALTIIGILVAGAILGAVLFGLLGILLGVPFVLIIIGVVIGKETLERQARIMQMKRFRNTARAEKFQFTESDKHTTV